MKVEEIIYKCTKGDREAWDTFIRRYEGLVTKSVRYKLKNSLYEEERIDYADIVQEVFLNIWEGDKLKLVKDVSTLDSWLCIVSINITANYCKNKLFRKELSTLSLDRAVGEGEDSISFKELVPQEGDGPLDVMEKSEMVELVKGEMSKMPDIQHIALKFNLFDGRKQKDISRIMNVPMGTVATLIRRGKSHLKEKIERFLSETV